MEAITCACTWIGIYLEESILDSSGGNLEIFNIKFIILVGWQNLAFSVSV